MKKEKKRVVFEIEASKKDILDEYIDWGMGRKLWEVITDDLILALSNKEDRETILFLIVNKKLKLRDWSRLLNEELR